MLSDPMRSGAWHGLSVLLKPPECLGHCLVAHAEPARDRAGRHAATTQDVCPFSYLLVDEGLGLARGAAKAGDRAAAAQEYLRILQIVPDQPEARRELARLGRAAGS
jgi:hypothetical protein